MNEEIIKILKNLGFGEKIARTYLSCLFIGEASVKDIAKFSRIKRTSVYNFIEDMIEKGLIYEIKHDKKVYYAAISIKEILNNYKKNVADLENKIELIEEEVTKNTKKQKIDFLHGPSGFKEVWSKIFKSSDKEYRIMTDGSVFFDYVTFKYLTKEIIEEKKKDRFKSMQIIPATKYALEVIVPKDKKENRETRFLPAQTKLEFTEIICSKFVAYISPRNKSSIFIIEDEVFAQYKIKTFDILWERLK